MAQRPEFDVPSSPENAAGILATAPAANTQGKRFRRQQRKTQSSVYCGFKDKFIDRKK